MTTRRWAVVLVVLLVTAETVVVLSFRFPLHLTHSTLKREIVMSVLAAPAIGLLSVARLPRSLAVRLVLVGGALLQIMAVSHPPVSSDDDFRYAWDAHVQLSGTDPYRYPPAAPELIHKRDAFDFPIVRHCPFYVLADGSCTTINRPTGRTIYPPVAQLAFDTMYVASFGGHGGHRPLQIAAALGAMAIALLLARRRVRPWLVAVWAWSPITVIELGNNAHIDWLAALLSVLALGAYARRHERRAGFLVGAAAMVKLYPALIGAAMLRRRPVVTIVAAASVVVVSYLPHVLAVGRDVIGYLPTYLQDEQYLNGQRFLLFHGLIHNPTHLVFALLVVATAVIVVRTDPDRPEFGALAMVLVATALTTPGQGWYSALLLALIVLTGRIGALPLVVVPSLVYLIDGDFGVHLARDAQIYRWGVGLSVIGLGAQEALIRRSRRTRTA